MRTITLSLLVSFFTMLIPQSSEGQSDSLQVLFIGNSFIAKNSLPEMFKQLSTAAGKVPHFDQYTPAGYSLKEHSEDPITIEKVSQCTWDVVILQEQGQIPSNDPGRDTMMYPYAVILDSIIHHNNPCTKIMFFLTWANKYGDINIIQQGGSDSYDAMQQRIREGYFEIADSTGNTIIPAGIAWKHIRDNYPAYELYEPGDVLPTLYGSYLAACVVFSSVYKESCLGNIYNAGINDIDVANLQGIASSTVLDSLELWNNGTFALFDFVQEELTVQLNNNSCNSNLWTWNFGDMTEPSVEENPLHIFNQPGNYLITLISSDSCIEISDTISMMINVSGNSILNPDNDPGVIVFPNPANDFLNVNTDGCSEPFKLSISDIVTGKKIFDLVCNSTWDFQVNISGLKQGIYLLMIEKQNSVTVKKFLKL